MTLTMQRARRRARWVGQRVGEASHPGPPVNVTWVVSKTAAGRQCPNCRGCEKPILEGDLRIQSEGDARQRRNYMHKDCSGSPLQASHRLKAGGGPSAEDTLMIDQHNAVVPELRPLEDESIFIGDHLHLPIQDDVAGEIPPGPVLDGVPRGLSWFDGKDLLELLADLPGTYSKVPARAHTAHAQLIAALAKRAKNRGRIGHTQESLQAWKALLLVNALLHYRDPQDPATKKRAGQGATAPEVVVLQRIQAMWRGEWGTLWRQVSEARRGPTPEYADKGLKGWDHQVDTALARRVRKARRFIETGQPTQALRALRLKGEVATDPEAAADIRRLLPEAPTMRAGQRAAAYVPQLDEETRDKLVGYMTTAICRAPRGRSAGAEGAYAEQWQYLRAHPAACKEVADLMADWALGRAPREVDTWLNAGKLTALKKPQGGIRPIAILTQFRRLALQGVWRWKKEAMIDAAGDKQFGCGRKGGADLMFKTLLFALHRAPGDIVMGFDATNVFGTLRRDVTEMEMAGAVPVLRGLWQRLYGSPTHMWWEDGRGRRHRFAVGAGTPQGCPLSPAAFSIAIAPILEELARDFPAWTVTAYLDDIVVVGPAGQAVQFQQRLAALMRTKGVEMNEGKTQVWARAGVDALPQELRRYYVPSLKVVGSMLARREGRLDEEEALGVGDEGLALDAVATKLGELGAEMKQALAAGLTWQEYTALLRWTGAGYPTHVLRAHPHTMQQCAPYDAKLRELWEEIMGAPHARS